MMMDGSKYFNKNKKSLDFKISIKPVKRFFILRYLDDTKTKKIQKSQRAQTLYKVASSRK